MGKTTKKTGRKQRHFISAGGKIIEGLSRMPDGRWRVIGTQVRFTEPDEERAIERFHKLADPFAEAKAKYGVISFQGSPADQLSKGFVVLDDARMWRWIGQQIRARPKWVAGKTGIEQISYLSDLKPPKPLPSFKELEEIWRKHSTAGKEQIRKVLAAWGDFKKTALVAGIEDITPEVCIAFRDAVYQRNHSGKSQLNLFSRIRRLLSFAKSRAIAVGAITEALNNLSLLIPSDTTVSLDPNPIEVTEFASLLKHANGDDRAMVLLMLNCAMYLQEVIDLKWSDIHNGCLTAHRKKTGKCVRVAVLWPDTVQAVNSLKKRGEYLFVASHGKQIGIKGAELRFRNLRDAAGIPHVTSSQLRDGAYTAAVEANVNQQLCQLLVGHRTGIADHYVKRKPSMVEPACKAIRKHYLS